MSETILKTKSKSKSTSCFHNYKKKPPIPFSTQALADRNMLKDFIIRKGLSIYEASVRCDIDECRANFVLFDKKPTQNQIDYALEIYNKGLPMLQACVASGVSFETFKKIRREQMQKDRKPQRIANDDPSPSSKI
jgi:hypothetical protein